MTDIIGPGRIHVYTGAGKGKTTAALGLAFRAVGRGLRVLVIQFLKGEGSGECEAADSLAGRMEIRSRGRATLIGSEGPTTEDAELAAAALDEAGREITGRQWDVVILDELNTAVHMGLVRIEEVLDLMEDKPEGLELVLTGRYAPGEFIDKADLVTEMREIKHYYAEGVPARRGIEK